MNDLSWTIYLIDVVSQLDILTGVASIIGTVSAVIALVVMAVASDQGENAPWHWFKWIVPSLVFVILLNTAAPSRETLYMIAASEVGETAVASEAGKAVMGDIKAVLDAQLERLKGG